MIPDVAHLQRVNLSHRGSRCGDQDGLVRDPFLYPVFETGIATAPVLDRDIDRCGGQFRLTVRRSNLSRFGENVGNTLKLRGQLGPVRGPAGRYPEKAGHCIVFAFSAVFPRHLTDQSAIGFQIRRIGIHAGVDIRFDLEVAAKLRIGGKKRVIPVGRTNQHDFDTQIHRFGGERAGNGRRKLSIRLFDADFAVAQRTFQCVPYAGVARDGICAKDQHSSVCTMKRAWLNQREIGFHGSHRLAVFDPSEKILIGGIRLDDHRCVFSVFIVDQQIDRIPAFRRKGGRPRVLIIGRQKYPVVVYDVVAQFHEPAAKTVMGGKFSD